MKNRKLTIGTLVAVTTFAAAALVVGGLGASSNARPSANQSGFDTANLDRSCKPCDDFFQFANGGWIKNNPIPPEYPQWGSFVTLIDKNQQVLRRILEAAAANTGAPRGSNEQKIGDLYASCMDTSAINAQRLKPLATDLAAIDAIHDTASLLEQAAHLQSKGVGVLFNFGSDQDFKDSTQVIAEANQGGLGLPDRDYYTRDDEPSQKLRQQYTDHVAKVLTLAGDAKETAATEARKVLAIEIALAKASMTNVELRDPAAVYHKMPIEQVLDLTPRLPWELYFRALGAAQFTELNIGQPEFFKAMDAMLGTVPLSDWKAYYRWHLLSRASPALSDDFVQEDFDFSGRTLQGVKEQRPRWKRCTSAVNRDLGEALGEIYVRDYFPPAAKARALELVHNLIAALRDDLQTLLWMSPATRTAANEKLQAFTIKIGYPEKWRDYSALAVGRSSYSQNIFSAAQFETARDLAKIGKPVDRGEWGMTPPTVDAYNNGQLNEIVFPAGILQPPFYDPNRDDAYNYGGIGAVIGHEITHGFDDEGAQFDLHGNMKNWWTSEDLKSFQDRGNCVAQQFNGYEVEKGLHENGKLVEGESIADLGGAVIAYAAYKKSQQSKPAPAELDGFSPDQRFFLGFAQNWAVNTRPESARLQANTNPHPLPRFRTNGPLSNMAEFARAFGCTRGDPMVREHVCKIW